jgi:hypothetical protein
MTQPSSRRLDSWKEIAEYVGRDVRTAIRWEDERGLPVHRVPGGKRGSVFAFTDEVDHWLLSVAVDGGNGGAPGGPAAPDSPVGSASHGARSRRSLGPLRWTGVAVAGVALVALAVALLEHSADRQRASAAPVAGISLAGTELVAFDEKHRALWAHDFRREVVALQDPPDVRPPRLFCSDTDLDGDGRRDLIVSVRFGTHVVSRGELYAFSAGGRLLWSREIDDVVTFGGGRFSAPWRDLSVGDAGPQVALFDVDGRKRIAWAQSHQTWWPSILTVLDGAGRPLSKWVHSGLIYVVVATGPPGRERLLVGGVSNSREAAFFAVLDARHAEGAGLEEPGSPFECLSCSPGRPLRYFTIQPSEQILTEAPYNHVRYISATEEGIEVRTRDNRVGIRTVEAILQFSPDFELEHAAWSSAWAAGHRDLEREGKLDHAVAECPERDRPPHVREWTAEGGWRDLTPPVLAVGPRPAAATAGDGRPR